MLGKPDALPTCTCSGKSDAQNVSKSPGAEDKPQKHLDHISEAKDNVSDLHCGTVRQPIVAKDAMKIPVAQAAVDKSMGQVAKLTRLGLR